MNVKFVLASFALVLLLGTTAVNAWWCTGHMTIAEIARRQLSSDVQYTVDNIISKLKAMGPFPKAGSMIEAACWADDLKENQRAMEGWHFLNLPYNPDSVPITINPIQHENVAETIPQMEDSIRYYPNDWEMTFALGNLIHFYGDIHQPLHVTELFSSTFPDGDLGGNKFFVQVNGTTHRLHSLWDSVCGQFWTSPNRPLSTSDRSMIEDLAAQYVSQYTFTTAETSEWNTTKMADEGYLYAVQYAYASLSPNDTITSDYLTTCEYYAERRIALAGLRLANDLTYLFDKSSKDQHGQIDPSIVAKKIAARLTGAKEEIRRLAKQRSNDPLMRKIAKLGN